MAQSKIVLSVGGVILVGVAYFLLQTPDKKPAPTKAVLDQPAAPQKSTAVVVEDAVKSHQGEAEPAVEPAKREPVVEPAEGPLEHDPAVYQAKQLIELTMNRGPAAFLKPTKIEELIANPDYNPQGKALAEADLARLTELAHQWDEQIANARMHDQIVLQQETMDAIKRGDYTIVDSAHTERMPVSPSDLLKREGTLSVGFCPGPRGSSKSNSRLVVLTKESSPNYAFSRKELGRLKQERMAALRVFISQAPGH